MERGHGGLLPVAGGAGTIFQVIMLTLSPVLDRPAPSARIESIECRVLLAPD
jgi:hypothetical protein